MAWAGLRGPLRQGGRIPAHELVHRENLAFRSSQQLKRGSSAKCLGRLLELHERSILVFENGTGRQIDIHLYKYLVLAALALAFHQNPPANTLHRRIRLHVGSGPVGMHPLPVVFNASTRPIALACRSSRRALRQSVTLA